MSQQPARVPFTSEDYAFRMRRAVDDAVQAGLDGLLITPGPDLVWLTGYQPTAITERLTVLVLDPDREPTLLVPTLERPDAESAMGAGGLSIVDWVDGEDPFARASTYIRHSATMGISDAAWALRAKLLPSPRCPGATRSSAFAVRTGSASTCRTAGRAPERPFGCGNATIAARSSGTARATEP